MRHGKKGYTVFSALPTLVIMHSTFSLCFFVYSSVDKCCSQTETCLVVVVVVHCCCALLLCIVALFLIHVVNVLKMLNSLFFSLTIYIYICIYIYVYILYIYIYIYIIYI